MMLIINPFRIKDSNNDDGIGQNLISHSWSTLVNLLGHPGKKDTSAKKLGDYA
jgi:hypothetical protein